MTITIDAAFAGLLLSVVVMALAGYGALLVVIWQSVNNRLRTLGHEDRDIRNQLHGMLETMEAHYDHVLDSMQKSNALMAHVYTSRGNLDLPDSNIANNPPSLRK